MTNPFVVLFIEEAVGTVQHEIQEDPMMTDPFAEELTMKIVAPYAEETMAEQLEDFSNELGSYFCDKQIQAIDETVKRNERNDIEIERNQIADLLAVPMVVLEDIAPHLEQSKCFCKDCKILLPTPKALHAHNTTAHLLSTARPHKEVKSTAKSTVNVVRKSIVATDKNSAQKGMSNTDKIFISKRNETFKSTAQNAACVTRESTTTRIKKRLTIKDSTQNSKGNANNLHIPKYNIAANTILIPKSNIAADPVQMPKSNIAANPILIPKSDNAANPILIPKSNKDAYLILKQSPLQSPKSPTVDKSPRKRKGDVESGTLTKKEKRDVECENMSSPSVASPLPRDVDCETTSPPSVPTSLPQASAVASYSEIAESLAAQLQLEYILSGGQAVSDAPRSHLDFCSELVNYDQSEQFVVERLLQLSEGENDKHTDSVEVDEGIDFTAGAPAHFPEDLEDDYLDFYRRQDDVCDKLLAGLLNQQTDDNLRFDWTNSSDSFLGRRKDFVARSGPTFAIESETTPLDIFLKFFDDKVFELIVVETNRNCDDLCKKTFQEHSRFNRLKPTDSSEMAVFLAVLILQGVLPLSVEKDYFKENGYLTLKNFKSLMSYNRFILLKRLLHFTDSDGQADTNTDNEKLRLIRPLLNLLKSKFQGLYLPSRDIAIDESLLKWRGRLSFAQKIATNAAKVGIKTYELCESKTGYCWSFIVFVCTGKGHTHRQTDRQDRPDGPITPTNQTLKIILDLVRPLLNRGHTLVMDNFYNSPLLARYLKQNGTDCFGTLRVNREYVPEAIKLVSKSTLRPGEMVQSYTHDLSVTLYRNSNLVAMLSTIHGEVDGIEKHNHYKYKPQVVLDYNLSMGRVDKKNQLLSSHPLERKKNQDWCKKVFRRVLNVTVLNAYIIFKTRHPRITQSEFRTILANDLIARFKQQSALPVNWGNGLRPFSVGNHFFGVGLTKIQTCVWCRESCTRHVCKQCGVHLHVLECFEKYHTVRKSSAIPDEAANL